MFQASDAAALGWKQSVQSRMSLARTARKPPPAGDTFRLPAAQTIFQLGANCLPKPGRQACGRAASSDTGIGRKAPSLMISSATIATSLGKTENIRLQRPNVGAHRSHHQRSTIAPTQGREDVSGCKTPPDALRAQGHRERTRRRQFVDRDSSARASTEHRACSRPRPGPQPFTWAAIRSRRRRPASLGSPRTGLTRPLAEERQLSPAPERSRRCSDRLTLLTPARGWNARVVHRRHPASVPPTTPATHVPLLDHGFAGPAAEAPPTSSAPVEWRSVQPEVRGANARAGFTTGSSPAGRRSNGQSDEATNVKLLRVAKITWTKNWRSGADCHANAPLVAVATSACADAVQEIGGISCKRIIREGSHGKRAVGKDIGSGHGRIPVAIRWPAVGLRKTLSATTTRRRLTLDSSGCEAPGMRRLDGVATQRGPTLREPLAIDRPHRQCSTSAPPGS